MRGGFGEGCSNLHCWEDFREREDFSLEIQAIQPLAVFWARRKNVLRGASYAWTPGSGVSSSSLSRIFSLLEFLLPFKCFTNVSVERGRWIGPKTWDRIIGNIFLAMVQP